MTGSTMDSDYVTSPFDIVAYVRDAVANDNGHSINEDVLHNLELALDLGGYVAGGFAATVGAAAKLVALYERGVLGKNRSKEAVNFFLRSELMKHFSIVPVGGLFAGAPIDTMTSELQRINDPGVTPSLETIKYLFSLSRRCRDIDVFFTNESSFVEFMKRAKRTLDWRSSANARTLFCGAEAPPQSGAMNTAIQHKMMAVMQAVTFRFCPPRQMLETFDLSNVKIAYTRDEEIMMKNWDLLQMKKVIHVARFQGLSTLFRTKKWMAHLKYDVVMTDESQLRLVNGVINELHNKKQNSGRDEWSAQESYAIKTLLDIARHCKFKSEAFVQLALIAPSREIFNNIITAKDAPAAPKFSAEWENEHPFEKFDDLERRLLNYEGII